MDLGTTLGLLGGLGIVLGAILMGSDLMAFVNIPSILVVFGGTCAAVLIRFPIKQLTGAFKVALKAFKHRTENPRCLLASTSPAKTTTSA